MADKYRYRLFDILKSYYQGILKEDYFLDSAEQRLYRKIYFETFRHLGFIEKALGTLYKTAPDADARAALALGACQILFMNDIPEYAAVNESVSLVDKSKKSFVNAVLRNLARKKDELMAGYNIRKDFPDWFTERWQKRLGDDLDSFLNDLNQKPSFYSVDRDTMQISKVRDESDGYIMDYASYSVARLAGDISPLSVLDCCAAPGGKTFVLSGTYPDSRVFAVEKNKRRYEQLKENTAHLKNVDCVCADILELDTEAEFDLVLLDAPCTALGTIKRHPEVRWLRKQRDIKECSKRQKEMLDKAAGFTGKNSTLIYSVCSLEPEETTEVIENFLTNHTTFSIVSPQCDEIFINNDFFVSLPYKTDADGFFACVLKNN
ncbi:MAG: transcription antitermination factor NusB [Deferribacterales bacterium]